MLLPVAPLAAIPDPGLLASALPNGERIVLIRRGNIVTALADACTHQAMPLSSGELLSDGTIECPWHGARFDCATGECRQGPATDDVPAYEVRVENGQVLVDVSKSP